MKEKISTEELDIAREVINIGLGKAADSMSFFTKEKVYIRSIDLQIKDKEAISKISQKKTDEQLYVLTTEVKGELEGVCYLVFSEKEVNELLKVALPQSILDDPEKLKVMSEAILLEMDNIIVASVITQFSNLFNYKMYGDVPYMSKTLVNGFAQIIESASKSAEYMLYFKSEFNTTGMDINPEFIWMLDEKYIQGVKSIAQNEGILKKMRL